MFLFLMVEVNYIKYSISDFPNNNTIPRCIACFLVVLYKKAFAWFSDLLVEHAEIFWSLFAVDMDSCLEVQPPDTWDSFPLFQLMNDYLRSDSE